MNQIALTWDSFEGFFAMILKAVTGNLIYLLCNRSDFILNAVYNDHLLRHKIYMFCLQDDLIDAIVLPHITRVDVETDPEVRLKVVELIIDLAESCTSDHFFQLFDVIKKVISLCLILLLGN